MSNTSSLVSVVIPTYNRAHIVGRAIRSVLSQTYHSFEIIVVDDCSTDNTKDVVKDFNDQKVKYIKHEKNRGPSAARNTGIKASIGEYIGFLDSDDEWFPEKLDKQVSKFQELPDTVGVIYCGALIISDETGQVLRTRIPEFKGNVYFPALRGLYVGGSCVSLIRKECFQKVGIFDEALITAEDWEMSVRIAKYFKFDFITAVLTKIHMHSQQLSYMLEGKIKSRQHMLQKHYNELLKYPVLLADHLNRLGVLCCIAGNFAEGKKFCLFTFFTFAICTYAI